MQRCPEDAVPWGNAARAGGQPGTVNGSCFKAFAYWHQIICFAFEESSSELCL